MTKKDKLSNILKNINSMGGVEGSAVVTRDGLLIESDISSNVDSETFAAMSATMFGAAETALMELDKGMVDNVMIESKEAKVMVTGAGSNAILVLMVSAKINIGLVFVEIRKAASKIEKIIK